MIALYTGRRRGAILDLQWRQVTIHPQVRASLSRSLVGFARLMAGSPGDVGGGRSDDSRRSATICGRLPALGRDNLASHVTERHGACDTAVSSAFVMGLIDQKSACRLPREGCDPVSAGIYLDPSGAAAYLDRSADEAEGYAPLPALEGH
jgi:hypothetical protein